MGGDHELMELLEIIRGINALFPELAVALYTGNNSPPKILMNAVDYIKVGCYDKHLGGLTSKDTNQVMYKVTHTYEDITYIFQKRHEIMS